MPEQGSPDGVRKLLVVGGGVLYCAYIGWSIFLMSFLPRPAGTMRWLIAVGNLTALLMAILLLGMGALAFMRMKAVEDIDEEVQKKALLRIGIAIVPGLLLSIMVPLMISRDPSLPMRITEPTIAEDFIAPLAVTFSLEEAADILRQYGLQALQYEWDFEGDKKVNQRTVVPTATAVYDREGAYSVAAKIILANGKTRKASRRLIIQRAAVALTPPNPFKEKTIVFSLAHLIDDPQQIVQIAWDFESDGNVDEVTKTAEASYTYFRTGRYTVTAVLRLQNKTQVRYQRSFDVRDPPTLPFPVAVITSPLRLISPPPFSVLFRLQTNEPIGQAEWSFGDRAKEEGMRVSHTYEQVGIYPVITKVRSKSGALAELVTVVRVGEELQLPELIFEGSHPVDQGKVEGEVPLKLSLTPRSTLRNIEYEWEAPDATEVGSTKATLQVVYRVSGTFTVVLVAEDAEHRSTRIPIKVLVKPPSPHIDFRMDRDGDVAPVTVNFDASPTTIPGDDISNFEWSFGDEEGTSQKFVPGSAHMPHVYEKPGTYTVTLRVRTKSGKNDGTVSKTIGVREAALRARAQVSRTSGRAPLAIVFHAVDSTGSITHEWDFGDGSQGEGLTFTHTFEDPGTYTVTLTVRDEGKREDTWTVTISVLP